MPSIARLLLPLLAGAAVAQAPVRSAASRRELRKECDQVGCPCRAATAERSLRRTARQTLKVASSAEMGVVDRGDLEATTNAASESMDLLQGMLQACAASCKAQCPAPRGCRVSRLLNQTAALQRGLDEAAEVGFFVDDERTMTALPAKLNAQGTLAKGIALELAQLATRCTARQAKAVLSQATSGAGALES